MRGQQLSRKKKKTFLGKSQSTHLNSKKGKPKEAMPPPFWLLAFEFLLPGSSGGIQFQSSLRDMDSMDHGPAFSKSASSVAAWIKLLYTCMFSLSPYFTPHELQHATTTRVSRPITIRGAELLHKAEGHLGFPASLEGSQGSEVKSGEGGGRFRHRAMKDAHCRFEKRCMEWYAMAYGLCGTPRSKPKIWMYAQSRSLATLKRTKGVLLPPLFILFQTSSICWQAWPPRTRCSCWVGCSCSSSPWQPPTCSPKPVPKNGDYPVSTSCEMFEVISIPTLSGRAQLTYKAVPEKIRIRRA